MASTFRFERIKFRTSNIAANVDHILKGKAEI
jgi:hypothetical protein